MIIAHSRSSAQLLASRVVLVQCSSAAHWKGNTRHTHSQYTPLHNTSSYPPYILHGSTTSISTRLITPMYPLQGQLINPFLPPLKSHSIFTSTGWAEKWRSAKNTFLTLVSSQQIRSRLKPLQEKFNSRVFRVVATNLYTEINNAIAAGDTATLRGLLTETMYTKVAREMGLKDRPNKGVNLSWNGELNPPRVVCVRFTRVSAEKLEDFGQVTVYFSGKQTINVNEVSGKVISTSSSSISEYWTFERHLNKYGAWRLCAKPTHSDVASLSWS